MASPEKDSNFQTKRRLWGRRIGRPLRKDRLDALENVLPVISVPKELLTEERNLSPEMLFGSSQETWLEIGFGSGEHMLGLMERHPDINFLGAEPFVNGVSNFLKGLGDKTAGNVRILMDDALLLVRSLTDESLTRIYILNPDPWPKVRHNKRRIVSKANLDEFARILKPGGQLILTTDVADLADWMITHTFNHPAFQWQAERADDWRIAPQDWIPTKYEIKQANHSSKKMAYMFFRKRAA